MPHPEGRSQLSPEIATKTGPNCDPPTPARATVTLPVDTPEQMVGLGRRLADLLQPGDVLLLSGPLGAGKTTLARGIGQALGVRGQVSSPTFVLARVHPPATGSIPLVHVDAYRLGSVAELDDLDLDASLADSVTLVEWGEGKAEGLAPHHLRVQIQRPVGGEAATGGDETEPRTVTVSGAAPRWSQAELESLTTPSPPR